MAPVSDSAHYSMKIIMLGSDTIPTSKPYGVVMNEAGPINTHPTKATIKPPITKY